MEDLGLDGDSWENVMDAMFGYLCFNNVYIFVPSCTGATHPVVSYFSSFTGAIWLEKFIKQNIVALSSIILLFLQSRLEVV